MLFQEQNGSYTYTVASSNKEYSPSPSSGSFAVNGAAVQNVITFTQVIHSVTFNEVGLPSGTTWSVILNGSTQSSTTSSIVFYEPNGTYSYITEAIPGWSPTPTSGSVTLNRNISIEITFIIKTYEVTFEESGLQSGGIWYLNLTGYNSSGPIRTSTYSVALVNGTYYYTTSQDENYFAPNGSFTVNGRPTAIEIRYEKFALMEIDLQPSTANLFINGNDVRTGNGIFQEYVKEGYYFINATEIGYTAYSNLVYLSWNQTYWQNITLEQIGEYGYLAGTVIPGNATILANGIPVSVSNGFFNASLVPGMYYISVTARGYEGYVTVVNVSLDEATSLEIVLKTTSTSITVSGYVVPSNSSVTVNGLVAYVNSTGFYRVYVPSGNVSLSAYRVGYYSYTVTLNLDSSREVNITLVKEQKAESTETTNGTAAMGYGISISNVTVGSGIISVTYNATSNGTLVVALPEKEIVYDTIADLLNSKVFVDGVQYKNFTITLISNGSAVLTVYGLSGDPVLYWQYSPTGTVPVYYSIDITESGLLPGTNWYVVLSNGQKLSSTNSTIAFSEKNGSYSFVVENVSGYLSLPINGQVVVDGEPVTESVVFTHFVYLTGTISPANSTLQVNQKSITTENGTFNITLISGTYEIEVSANGYSTYLKNVTVSGTTSKLTSLTIILQKKPTSILFWLIIAVILTVIVAVIAILVTFVIKSRKTEPK
jgi:hypothetical protein